MIKVLILLAVVGLAIWWLRRARSADDRPSDDDQPLQPNGKGKRDPAGRSGKPGNKPADKPTPMLACAHCGVHLPQAEALTDAAGRPFCGEAHRLAGPR